MIYSIKVKIHHLLNLPIRFAEDREAEDYLKVGSFYHKGKNIEIGSSLIAVNDTQIKTPSELDFFLRGKTGEAKLTFKNDTALLKIIQLQLILKKKC